ncbi:MAG: FAD binding domain-containing protein [Spirochaetes bacterium]|nr:FAD binding domain-containing protein [Spirochaetota bacterium]
MRISEIHYPSTIQETVTLLSANPAILLLAGGTEIVGTQTARVIDLADQVACISRISELRKTMRTEQFIELGACTTLTGLLSLSKGILPEPLPSLIHSIANPAVRNSATLGGNLCVKRGFMDLWPLLSCMEAQVELRAESGTRWASVSHLCGADGRPYLPEASLIARIRIPIYSYNFVFLRKLGSSSLPSPDRACFVCLANLSGDKIVDFRLALSGVKAFRLKDLEMTVSGRRRNTGKKEMGAFVAEYEQAFGSPDWFDSRVFSALVEESFERLYS